MSKLCWFFCLCALIALQGCKKTTECSYRYQHVAGNIAFINFAREELDSIVIDQYRPNGKFDSLTTRYTLSHPHLTALHDTLVLDSLFGPNMYPGLTDGYDYEVSVVYPNEEFRITGISYSAQDYTYTTEQTCPHGTYGLAGPDKAYIDGAVVEPFVYNPGKTAVFPPLVFPLRR